MAIYQIYNAASPTTAITTHVTTGTAIKTMLQVTGTAKFKVIEWGISFDGAAAAAGIECELLETGTVAATVTAHVASGIVPWDADQEAGTVHGLSLGTAATGFTATAEGTITATRVFDYQKIQPTNQYIKQFPLGREPIVDISAMMRIRLIAAAAVNAVCYVTIEL